MLKIFFKTANNWIKANRILAFFVLASAIVALGYIAVIAFYLCKILPVDSYTTDRFGQFGDFVGGVCNPILGFLTLAGILLSLFYQRKQILQSKNDALRSEFFDLAGLLSEIIDKINVSPSKLNSFDWLIERFRCHVGRLVFMRIKAYGAGYCYSEAILRCFCEDDNVVNSLDDIGSSKLALAQTIRAKFDVIVNEISFDGVLERVAKNSNARMCISNDFLDSLDPKEVQRIMVHASRKVLIESKYVFGPFVKTAVRIMEICNKSEGVALPNNLWGWMKSQLSSSQMFALMINALAGKLNREHDTLLREHDILNDVHLLDDPILDKASQVYYAGGFDYPK